MPAQHRRGRNAALWFLTLLLVCGPTPAVVAADGDEAGTAPPPVVSDEEFSAFVEDAAECADWPVPSLLYVRKGEEERLASLNVEAKWLSARARSIDDITVCTNSNFERLHMLEAQCESWGGPVSAVVYVPLSFFNESNTFIIEQAIRDLTELHSRIEESGACMLDLVLVSELLQPDRAWAYPYNSLRNQAIARTKTKLLVLLDVDFLLRSGLRQHLLEPSNWGPLLHDAYTHKDVAVLPAFETKPGLPLEQGMEIAARAHRSTKGKVKAMFREEEVVQFAPFYKRGHTATDYKQWFKADRPYPIAYEAGFEPFVLMSRLHVPWYDERFRGYGWDKITHIYHMDQLGYNLVVHPFGFVVHRPHPPSAGYNATFTGPAYSQGHKPTKHMKTLNKVAKDMMRDLRDGSYPLYGVTALAGCRRLDLFTRAASELPAWAAAAAEGTGALLSSEQRNQLRVADPVPGWW